MAQALLQTLIAEHIRAGEHLPGRDGIAGEKNQSPPMNADSRR